MPSHDLCLIDDPDNPTAPLVARRVAEDLAIVMSVTEPGRPQRFGDHVVLEQPSPGGDRTPSVSASGLARFRPVATAHAGGYVTWRLVAPHPGDKHIMRLERQMAARGWAVALQHDASAGRVVELWLAAPEDASPIEIDALLGAVTDDWVHPPAYGELVARSGGNVAVHRHRTETYGRLAAEERAAQRSAG